MNRFLTNWVQIVKKLFGVTVPEDNTPQENTSLTEKYDKTTGTINVEKLISNKLVMLTLTNAKIESELKNDKEQFIYDECNKMWGQIERALSISLGVGGSVIIPYLVDSEILFNVIPQSRLLISDQRGDRLINITVLAEIRQVGLGEHYRYINYEIVENSLIIRERILDQNQNEIDPLKTPEDIIIPNVDRVPVVYLKNPIDNRAERNNYGVAITHGADTLIDRLGDNLDRVEQEFKIKTGLIYMDERAFIMDETEGIRHVDTFVKAVAGTNNDFVYEEYSPEIRHESYINYMEELSKTIEKQIGLSSGILSKTDFKQATATEIRRANSDTISVITKLQKAVSNALSDYAYAVDILSVYASLTPQGEYNITCNFEDAFKDTEGELSTLVQLNSIGIVSDVELRQYQFPHEDLEESQKVLDSIRQIEIEELKEEQEIEPKGGGKPW